jgi:hypothetical protein
VSTRKAAPKPPPVEAFRFAAQAAVDGDAPKDGVAGTFTGTAYSGDLIRNHWFWGSVIFDLSTTRAADRVPVLIQHDPGQRAGFASLTFGDQITAEGTLMANAHGEAVASESRAGFPWQMSVRIEPDSVEELASGATLTVNGRTVNGPAHIFRNSTIREVSFTPVGADPATDAQAMDHRFTAPKPAEQQDMELKDALDRISALEAENRTLAETARRSEAAAEAAQAALHKFASEKREAEVKALFAALGREHSAEAAAPYVAMDETTFAAVAADLRKVGAAKRPDDAVLFADQATGDGLPATEAAREQQAAEIAKHL